MFIRFSFVLFLSLFVCVAQTPVPTSFSFPVPVSFTAEHHNFDMVANELGMHIVYPSGTSIRHALIGANGRLISDTVVVSSISGDIRPSISSHIRNGIEELHISYRNGDSINIRRSTDGGISWLSPANSAYWAQTSASTNRLQMATDGDYVHVTWDTGTDEEVLYARYSLELGNWDQFKNLTDEIEQTGDSVIVSHGSHPDIVISEKNGTKRVHVVFINERWILRDTSCSYFHTFGDSLLFQQIVERSAVLSTGTLQ